MSQAGREGESDPGFESAAALFLDGVAAFNAGRFEDAERLFVASLDIVPERPSALLNLAATRLKLQRPVDAIAAADVLLAVQPDHVEALQARAGALASLGLHEHALDVYDGVLALDPSLADAWSQRGGVLREAGRLVEAAQAFEQAIARGGDAELNGYFLAAVRGGIAPPTAPAPYIEELFDDYSPSFDEHLVGGLGYRAPSVLADALSALDARRYGSALDLGCGTGLCGALVKPRADRLTGVDLSRHMLDQADARAIYDRLEQAEIVAWLATNREAFDLVVCTDVLIYIGDLSPVFDGVRRALAAGGVFCFSVERDDSESKDFSLLPSLRYAHSERYLRELASRHGFAVAQLLHAPLRKEERRTIAGLYGCLTMPRADRTDS